MLENLAIRSKLARLVGARGDGFATDPRVATLTTAQFAVYMEATLLANDEGVWGEYRRGTRPNVALGEAFRPLMEKMGAGRDEWRELGRAYESLVNASMIWAREGKLRVYCYWAPHKMTVDVLPRAGNARNKAGA